MPFAELPQLPYINIPSERDDTCKMLAQNGQVVPSELVGGWFNYMVDKFNETYLLIQDAIIGNIPGSNDPLNVDKILSTDGAGNIPWTKIRNVHFSERCIAGINLMEDSVDGGFHILDNSIPDAAISGMNGLKIAINSIPGDRIISLSGAKIQLNTIPSGAIISIDGVILQNETVLPSKLNGIVPTDKGGSGKNSHTPYGLLLGGTTATGVLQNTAAGPANRVLRGMGNAIPEWGQVKTGDMEDLSVTNAKLGDASITYPKFGAGFLKSNIYGSIQTPSTILFGQNISSVTFLSTGKYRVTLSINLGNTNYIPIVVPNSATERSLSVTNITSTSFDVNFNTNSSFFVAVFRF